MSARPGASNGSRATLCELPPVDVAAGPIARRGGLGDQPILVWLPLISNTCKNKEIDQKGDGAPDRIRTCDLWLRRPTLYPTELRAPGWSARARTARTFVVRRSGGIRWCSVFETGPAGFRDGLVRTYGPGPSRPPNPSRYGCRWASGLSPTTRNPRRSERYRRPALSDIRTCPGPRPSATICEFVRNDFGGFREQG